MAISKKTRILILIAVDTIFFMLEIIIGYTAHSLALVADAFHMLNDIISLCVGYWATDVAENKSSSNEYTYGVCLKDMRRGSFERHFATLDFVTHD